jgi:hypothetical protein
LKIFNRRTFEPTPLGIFVSISSPQARQHRDGARERAPKALSGRAHSGSWGFLHRVTGEIYGHNLWFQYRSVAIFMIDCQLADGLSAMSPNSRGEMIGEKIGQ